MKNLEVPTLTSKLCHVSSFLFINSVKNVQNRVTTLSLKRVGF